MNDVTVVGGGPGGLYCAQILARNGFRVSVLEEHRAHGTPEHCTGVLGAEILDQLDLPRQSLLNELRTVKFISPAGKTVAFTPDRVEALVIDRVVFDCALASAAQQAGAELQQGSRATSILVDSHRALIGLADGRSIETRAVVLACGANYALQRQLGLGVPANFLQSAQVEVPASGLNDVEMHFGAAVAPRGFAWAVPVRRPDRLYVRAGLMCAYRADSYFRSFLSNVGRRWMVPPDSAAPAPRRRMLPLAPIARTFADRLLVVGDAAGLVKPSTGGGIFYSVVSAGIAAEVLTDSLRNDSLRARDLSAYETEWKRQLGPELDSQLQLRRLLNELTDADIEAFFHLAQTNGIMPLVRATARFNEHRGLIQALLRHPQASRILLRNVLR